MPYKNNVLGPNAIFVKSKSENNKFLYYLFLSIYFQKELYKITSKTGQGKFNKTELKEILIPIPPLEIQEKIVKILDKFTNYATELQTELQLRTKQYEYYRNLLLSKNYLKKLCFKFGENSELKIATLGEICEIKSGGTPSTKNTSFWKNGDIPWLKSEVCKDCIVNKSNTFITQSGLDNSSAKFLEKGTVLMAMVGATIFRTGFLNFEATTNQNIAGIKADNKILNDKYLFYYLVNLYDELISKMSGYNMINLSQIKQIKILYPPLKVQNEVVRILDKFSDISSNLEKGLPKEIDLRQKEYEFYRDLLLNFKKD